MNNLPVCPRGHPRIEENTSRKGECLRCKRQRDRQRYCRMKDLPARELITRRQRDNKGRPLIPKTCPFQHQMTPLEHGVWFCQHPDCQVLAVLFNFPGTYRHHNGTHHLFFDLEESEPYLRGRQSLAQLVEAKLERQNSTGIRSRKRR